MRYYSGIGPRMTPPEVQTQLTAVAVELEQLGFVLRSGGAEGADKAFEHGVQDPNNKIILRPKDSTPEAEAIAESLHPAWGACNDYVRKLHGRNAQIVLGKDLTLPSEFVVCWTPNELQGGTSLGLRVARSRNVTLYNLFDQMQNKLFVEFMAKLKVDAGMV